MLFHTENFPFNSANTEILFYEKMIYSNVSFQKRGFSLLALLVQCFGGHAGLAKSVILSTVVLYPGVATQ